MITGVVEGCGYLLLAIKQKITRTNNKKQVSLFKNATFWMQCHSKTVAFCLNDISTR